MKFIRFGDLKAFEQKMYKKSPAVDEYAHCPPRRRGFFAFPYGFFDGEYIFTHPACDPNSPVKYLRDKSGRKLSELDFQRHCNASPELNERTRDMGIWESIVAEDNDFLKKLGLPKQPLKREPRPSWVCIMKDPRNPPHRRGRGRLNQNYTYLLDADGERIPSRHFFAHSWHPEDFEDCDSFHVCQVDDVRNDIYVYFNCPCCDCETVLARLAKRGIHVENLFPWPVYEHGMDEWLTIFKEPHLFDYTGCVWHHLREFVPPRAVLAAYGTTWVYTSVRDLETALRRAAPSAYRKSRNLRNQDKASLFGGPNYGNSKLDMNGMYEVFFDDEDIKKIT